jgi:hypothetical protein
MVCLKENNEFPTLFQHSVHDALAGTLNLYHVIILRHLNREEIAGLSRSNIKYEESKCGRNRSRVTTREDLVVLVQYSSDYVSRSGAIDDDETRSITVLRCVW